MSPLDPLLDLLGRAMDVPVTEREAFVREACAGDPDLWKRAWPLIQEQEADSAPDWDVRAARNLIAPVLAPPTHPLLDQEIGPWKLTRVLGEGGMGTVYLGERTDDAFHQEVAVKVIREGVAQSQTLNRFHQERQIQAALDHPGIASLIDAGHTENGQPYFVMEFVPGVRIDDRCDAEQLGPKQRILRLREICSAVQYLHDKGIVHRDLKPSNLMVQPNGRPKLLDFGVAQVLNQTALTANKPLPFVTPAYASPECLGEGVASPASDQYSLAVILHELLTGHRPTLKTSTELGTDRGPGVVDLSHLHEGSLAAYRPPRAFIRGLRAVMARAMNADPDQRYASVDEFSQDLGRLAEGSQVLALGRSPWQSLIRALRRHSIPIAASLAFIVTLAGLLIQTQIQGRRHSAALAQSERSRSAAEAHAQNMEHLAKEILTGLEGRLSLVPEASALREQSLAMGTAFFEEGHLGKTVPKRLLKTLLNAYWKLALLRMTSISPGGTQIDKGRAAFRKALELAPLLQEQDPNFSSFFQAMTEADWGGLETDQLRLRTGRELLESGLERFELQYADLFSGSRGRAYLRALIGLAANQCEREDWEGARNTLLKFDSEYLNNATHASHTDPLFWGATRPLVCHAGQLWLRLGERELARQHLEEVQRQSWEHPQDFRGSQVTHTIGKAQQLELQMGLQEPGANRGDLEAAEALAASIDREDLAELASPGAVSNAHHLRALMLCERGRWRDAEDAFMRSFLILRHGLLQDPSNAAWRDSLAQFLLQYTELLGEHGLTQARRKSALEEAREHFSILQRHGADAPSIPRNIATIDAALQTLR